MKEAMNRIKGLDEKSIVNRGENLKVAVDKMLLELELFRNKRQDYNQHLRKQLTGFLKKKLSNHSRTAADKLFHQLDYEVNLTYIRNSTNEPWEE